MDIRRPSSTQPLPRDAKRVFKGEIFEVYQWEVDGYDGTKKIFEKLKRPDTVGIIPITEDGKIVLTHEEQPGKAPFMGLAGGRVDEGEDILEAAKRELLEETGYEANEWILFNAEQPISKVEWAVYTFVARGCRKVAEQNLDGAEKIDVEIVNFDELVELALDDQLDALGLKVRLLEAKLNPEKMEEIKRAFFS